MLKRVFMAVAVAALTAAPALAEDVCGAAPVAPVVPGAADIAGKTPEDAHKVSSEAFKLVRIYQSALQPFYNCVEQQVIAGNTAIAEAKEKKDRAKIAALESAAADLNKDYQGTLATEKQVVADYMSLHDNYCKMGENLAGCVPAKAH
jgi:hypothetical protein